MCNVLGGRRLRYEKARKRGRQTRCLVDTALFGRAGNVYGEEFGIRRLSEAALRVPEFGPGGRWQSLKEAAEDWAWYTGASGRYDGGGARRPF